MKGWKSSAENKEEVMNLRTIWKYISSLKKTQYLSQICYGKRRQRKATTPSGTGVTISGQSQRWAKGGLNALSSHLQVHMKSLSCNPADTSHNCVLVSLQYLKVCIVAPSAPALVQGFRTGTRLWGQGAPGSWVPRLCSRKRSIGLQVAMYPGSQRLLALWSRA